MDIMLEGNSTWSHAPTLQSHFHRDAAQKRPHASTLKQRGVRKWELRLREGVGSEEDRGIL